MSFLSPICSQTTDPCVTGTEMSLHTYAAWVYKLTIIPGCFQEQFHDPWSRFPSLCVALLPSGNYFEGCSHHLIMGSRSLMIRPQIQHHHKAELWEFLIKNKTKKLDQGRPVVPSPAFLPRWSYKSRNQDRNTPESLSKLWPTLARCRPYYSLWHFSCLLGLELVSSVFISLASEFSETDLNLLALVTETLTWGRILNWHSLGEICRSRKNKKLIPL